MSKINMEHLSGMNNLVVLSTRAERARPKDAASEAKKAAVKKDTHELQRGAPMQSRSGIATKA
jgi:hypothetical protein